MSELKSCFILLRAQIRTWHLSIQLPGDRLLVIGSNGLLPRVVHGVAGWSI